MKIVKKEMSENFTVDIEVENTHSYLINNIISHNTINLSKDATKEDVSQVYIDAYKENVIGVTVYRDGCREGILVDNTSLNESTNIVKTNAPKRPKSLKAEVHHLTVSKIKYYVNRKNRP